MNKPKSAAKKGILATIWDQITATDCGCAPGSSCCGPNVKANDAEPTDGQSVEPVTEAKTGEK